MPRDWFAMTRLALALLGLGSAVVGACFVAWFLVLVPLPTALVDVAGSLYGGIPLGVGLFALALGVAAWIRAWPGTGHALPPLALLVGVAMIAITGFREIHAPASGMPQVPHAVLGIGATLLVLLGIWNSRRAFAPLAEEVALAPAARRRATLLRYIAYASLAAGILVPFTPLLFGDRTPRACAIRVAATGALVFAVPLLAASVVSVFTIRELGRARSRALHCPACGYPRPSGTRCPECGDSGESGISV